MPARIETTWDQIPADANVECRNGHQRNPTNTLVYVTRTGSTELRCRVCDRLNTAERRRKRRKTTNKGAR